MRSSTLPRTILSEATFSKYKVPKQKGKPVKKGMLAKLREDGCSGVLKDFAASFGEGDDDGGDDDEEEEDDEESSDDEEDDDEEGGSANKWSKVVNMGLDRSLGSLLRAGKMFIPMIDDVRVGLLGEFEKLERGSSLIAGRS